MVELSISVGILVTVLMAGMQSNLSARRLATEAKETQAAVRAIEAARSILEVAELSDIVDAGGDVEPGLALAIDPELPDQVVTYGMPDWAPGDPVPPVLGVRITVNWTSSLGQTRTMSVHDAER